MNEGKFSVGDFVEISGAYFKNDNGYYLVVSADSRNRLTLHKCGKTGKPRTSGANVSFWPLSSYCSDPRKNAAADKHNRENAKISRVNLPTYYAAEYFRGEAEKDAERVERYTRIGYSADEIRKAEESRDFHAAVANRLSATAEKPKEKAPEKGIRFYYNGIKIDGGKLIRCFYWLGDNSVSICVRDYDHLPHEYFTVENNSDPYSDYHDDDKAELTPQHPLYKYARYVALKSIFSSRSCDRPTAAQRAEWESMKDPGQPTAEDLAAVAEMKTAEESARIAAEHAEQLAEREKALGLRNAGRHYIENVAAAHPLKDGAPYVVIEWSENPAFYSWEDGELMLSVAAAEIVLRHFDKERHAENLRECKGGYDKTKFTIHYAENGEQHRYEGRYDLGDNDGGLIAHVRAFAESKRKPGSFQDIDGAESVSKLADMLEEHTEGGRVVSVSVAPWVQEFSAARKQANEKAEEETKQDMEDIIDYVQMLTDEQIEAAIMAIDPKGDKSGIAVARFFLQELARRDRENALEVFRRWRK